MAEDAAGRKLTVGEADEAARRAVAPEQAAIQALPETARKLAATARDLEALRGTVVDAAAVGGTLWLSYLFALFYLFIAAAAVTHADLFFERGVKLPFLNVDLPLQGFFWLGPLIFIILHAYVLLHFVLLAGKVGDFNTELRAQIADEDTRNRIRRQLPSNIFVQFLGAPREVRHGPMGALLRLVAWISLIIGPVALLVFFQLQFLPYHDEGITWWQRCAVLIDIGLLWLLWPAIQRGEGLNAAWRAWRRWRRGAGVAMAAISALPALLVCTVATFPGEWWHSALPGLRIVPVRERAWSSGEPLYEWRLASPHEMLIAGGFDDIGQRPASVIANVLVLPRLEGYDRAKFDSDAKFDAVSQTISLRGRRLEGAILIGAKLRKADLTGARLQGANLRGADLRGATLTCGYRRSEDHGSINCARLDGADLSFAELQGADLGRASLQGAYLHRASLQGAGLGNASLQGAYLNRASLQGADLFGASLKGAYLHSASLQGADLFGASLKGAYLHSASLQGADLRSASLQGAEFTHNCVWRAQTDPQPVMILVEAPISDRAGPNCHWQLADFTALSDIIQAHVSPGGRREMALQRIALLNPNVPLPDEAERAARWHKLAASPPDATKFEQARADAWFDAGCAAAGAPYVLRGILGRFDPATRLDWQRALAGRFLQPAACEAFGTFSAADKARLARIRDWQPPTAR